MSAVPASVARATAYQSARKLLRLPAKAAPAILMPLFMYAAFGGALGAVGETSGFGYYSYTAFVFVSVLFMAGTFSAVFTAFDVASDYETGFAHRLMLAAPRRLSIVWGYVTVSVVRCLFNVGVVFAVALATGLSVRGNVLEVVAMLALVVLVNVVTMLYGTGIALRFQSTSSSVLILIPAFMLFFLSPIFIPRHQLTGWLRDATDVNPLTPVLEAGRGFLAGDPVKVALAFIAVGGLLVFFTLWAIAGMRKAEHGSGGGSGRGPRARGPRARRAQAQAAEGAPAEGAAAPAGGSRRRGPHARSPA